MSDRKRKQIEKLQFTNINGLPDDVVHALHHSIVGLARMRRSIEDADKALERSKISLRSRKGKRRVTLPYVSLLDKPETSMEDSAYSG
jgi:hypothetical protein